MGRHRHGLTLFLIAALYIISLSADDVFESIDCGSSETYTDENLIRWTGDDNYIKNGESHVVQTKSTSPVLDTLRAFTTRNKNCFSIRADRGSRVLVRASFHYGNYDGKSSPPSFGLQLDGNDWATVRTLISDYVYYEVIYVVKGDAVNVCVAQTNPGEVPFISAIEVRSLILPMYDRLHKNYPLYLMTRTAYGANGTIRYIDDPYDRIWNPSLAGTGLTTVASDAVQFGVSSRDEPPPAVLKNAISTVRPTTRIQLNTGFPAVEVAVYFNMYFSEVRQLQRSERRAFHIVMNGKSLMEDAIVPPYENVTEIVGWNYTVWSNTSLILVPTNDSTLGPLINALEVFLIGDAMVDGTNTKDVDGLASLQEAFPVLQDWSGDPCLPAPFSWDWINCTTDSTPRVTALYLSSFDLSGELPDFSSMDALQTIDFHNNSLAGPIPEFLATLPNLKQLNLASNQFSGLLPDSLSKKSGLNLVVTGNPNMCTSGNTCKSDSSDNPGVGSSPTSGKKKSSKLPVILGATIPIFVIIWAIVGLITLLHYRRKATVVTALTSGATGPQASPLNPQMDKMGNAAMSHETKAKMEDRNDVEMAGQTHDHHGSGRSSFSD